MGFGVGGGGGGGGNLEEVMGLNLLGVRGIIESPAGDLTGPY